MRLRDSLKKRFTEELNGKKLEDAPPVEPKPGDKEYKGTKFRQMCTRPIEGMTWNPLTKYPVNKGCFCASGKKAKKCCLPAVAAVVSEDFASRIKANWKGLLDGTVTLPAAPRGEA